MFPTRSVLVCFPPHAIDPDRILAELILFLPLVLYPREDCLHVTSGTPYTKFEVKRLLVVTFDRDHPLAFDSVRPREREGSILPRTVVGARQAKVGNLPASEVEGHQESHKCPRQLYIYIYVRHFDNDIQMYYAIGAIIVSLLVLRTSSSIRTCVLFEESLLRGLVEIFTRGIFWHSGAISDGDKHPNVFGAWRFQSEAHRILNRRRDVMFLG